MSQDPGAPTAVGQISADGQFRWDGQQWVPLAAGYREPTPWTRPMQVIAAALFVAIVVYSIVSTAIFVNHDSVLRVLKTQNVTLPAGTTMNDVVNVSLAFYWGVVIFFVVLEIVAALGSYLGWRWMFWAAMVLFALSGLGAVLNIGSFASPDRSYVPIGALIITELLDVLGLAMFVWMVVGAIKYGPWAMKKPAP